MRTILRLNRYENRQMKPKEREQTGYIVGPALCRYRDPVLCGCHDPLAKDPG